MRDFETLWEQYSADVHRYAFRLCNDPALAEDLTSETFVRLWTGRAPLRPATLKAYIFTITRNLFLTHCRKQGLHTSLDEEPISSDPNQESTLENKQHQQHIANAWHRLRETDKTALFLRAEQGLTYEELAVILNLSTTAAKVKVHRARSRLKSLLANQEVPR